VIDDLNTIFGGGVYGYVTNNGLHAGLVGDNPNTTWDDADSYATCMALNNNYDPTYFPSPALASLQATAAHEFNHSIQYGYGTLTGGNEVEGNFVEGGATWMEDEVFDTANDNHFYLWPDFDQCMGEYSGDEYAYWITYRGLTEQYGTGAGDAGEQIMQDFWESVSQSSDNNSLDALNQALLVRGETLADSYHRYAVAANFIKPCSGGYVYPYCFEEGAKYLATAGPTSPHGAITTIGDDYSGSVRDFYALNWVDLPTGTEPISVTLKNDSSGGVLQMSLACDTGSSLRVWPMPALAGAGESSTLFYYDRTACTNITAVITNQAQTDPDPSSCPARNYTISTAVSNLTEHHYLPIALR
jgi:hypothetical protein